MDPGDWTAGVLRGVAERARTADVFGDVEVGTGRVACAAKDSAEPAWYRVEMDGGRLWVSLVMKDRWLSESIESDLVHHGDSLEELLAEELEEGGYTGPALGFEHFRSEDKLFTFRSALPVAPGSPASDASAVAVTCLLAYERCFRNLGDMAGGDEDE